MILGYQIDNPVRVRNTLKRMYKEEPAFCYSWDFDSDQVVPIDQKDYAAALLELQTSGLVKRCECWAEKRYIVGNGTQKSEEKEMILRMESYGHSKRSRILFNLNPLSFAFDTILVDYVFLFIEEEKDSKEKLIKSIETSMKNHRFYDAERKLTFLYDVFNENKNSKLSMKLNKELQISKQKDPVSEATDSSSIQNSDEASPTQSNSTNKHNQIVQNEISTTNQLNTKSCLKRISAYEQKEVDLVEDAQTHDVTNDTKSPTKLKCKTSKGENQTQNILKLEPKIRKQLKNSNNEL